MATKNKKIDIYDEEGRIKDLFRKSQSTYLHMLNPLNIKMFIEKSGEHIQNPLVKISIKRLSEKVEKAISDGVLMNSDDVSIYQSTMKDKSLRIGLVKYFIENMEGGFSPKMIMKCLYGLPNDDKLDLFYDLDPALELPIEKDKVENALSYSARKNSTLLVERLLEKTSAEDLMKIINSETLVRSYRDIDGNLCFTTANSTMYNILSMKTTDGKIETMFLEKVGSLLNSEQKQMVGYIVGRTFGDAIKNSENAIDSGKKVVAKTLNLPRFLMIKKFKEYFEQTENKNDYKKFVEDAQKIDDRYLNLMSFSNRDFVKIFNTSPYTQDYFNELDEKTNKVIAKKVKGSSLKK